jgi:iron complex outermembrane recepter protein
MLWRRIDTELDAERDFSSGFRPDRDYRNLSLFSGTGAQTSLGRSQLMLGYSDKPYDADQFYGPFNSWERTKTWFAGVTQPLGDNTELDFVPAAHGRIYSFARRPVGLREQSHR